MMNSQSLACALTLVALLSTSYEAAAQAPPAPAVVPSTATTSGRAAAAYKEGFRLGTEKNWAAAEVAFREAWALNPTADVAYNLGSTEYRLGKYRDAAEHLAFALRNWPLMEAMAKQRPLAEQRLRDSRAAVATLIVKVNVAHAEVLVDGKPVGKAPLADDVFVMPGAPHTVEARLEGYVRAKESVQVEKGAARTLNLALVTLPSAGALKPIDPTKPGGSGGQRPSGAERSIEGGPSKPLLIAGIASSAALVGAGVVFAIVSSVNAAEAQEKRMALLQPSGVNPCLTLPLSAGCAEFRDSLAAKGTFGNLSVFSFALGGALAIGTVIYAVATPKPKPKPLVTIVPMASAKAGGLVITGRW